ncbi:MAG: invasion associated locus B family protein [Mesorhizobium sp.]
MSGSDMRYFPLSRRANLGAVLVLAGVCSAAAQGLPGGASSLNETHGDWTVACTTPGGAVRCAASQTQVNGENRQRILAAELTATEGGKAAGGLLVLPFGLRLDSGVRLAIDEAAADETLRFSTCLPAGCLVPLSFDAAELMALQSGKALSITATANDGGQETAFSISLKGLSSALSRVNQLNGT